jgi:hypothetical protein
VRRKSSGLDGNPPSSRLRLTILLATVAAFMLVPAAQAFANGTATIQINGTGSGEVSSVGGAEEVFGEPAWEGIPPIECSYASPGPATGVCSGSELGYEEEEEEEGLVGIWIHINAAPGSEFTGFAVEEGGELNVAGINCKGNGYCLLQGNPELTGNVKVTVTFSSTGPAGPELTVTKEGSAGTVVSNPAGIECGATCKAAFTENSKVTLTASPAAGSVFKSWKGCEKGGAIGHTCTVTMDKAKTVVAIFGPVQSLTVGKAGSGTGSVKSSPTGISCDLNCSSNVAAFTEGASVVLTAVPTKYHTFTGWSGSGCSGTGTCTVTMSAAKSVTAEFAATKFNLTLSKAGGGTGATKSKPASLTCGATCSTVVSSFYAGTEVEVTATPSKGSTLNWSVGAGTCTGSTSPCFVTMSAAKSLTAEFK